MPGDVTRKWRPPLTLVVAGMLLVVFALPFLGVTWFRLAGNILGWWETALLIAWLAFVVTLVLAWLLWRLVLRPVWALTAYARAMKRGQADGKTPAQFGTAELSDLGQSVIDMGGALNARARSLTAYADHVTHELKSPLTSLQGAVDLLRDDRLDAVDRAALLDTLDVSSARMEQLLNDLRSHAAARIEAQPGTCRLSDAVDAVSDVEITIDVDGDVPMSRADLSRVLTQLARNAYESGATTVTVARLDTGVRVFDDGPGISVGDQSRIFDPFFTTRRTQGGTGMGLTIARTLVEAAGGSLRLIHAENAEFQIVFSRL